MNYICKYNDERIPNLVISFKDRCITDEDITLVEKERNCKISNVVEFTELNVIKSSELVIVDIEDVLCIWTPPIKFAYSDTHNLDIKQSIELTIKRITLLVCFYGATDKLNMLPTGTDKIWDTPTTGSTVDDKTGRRITNPAQSYDEHHPSYRPVRRYLCEIPGVAPVDIYLYIGYGLTKERINCITNTFECAIYQVPENYHVSGSMPTVAVMDYNIDDPYVTPDIRIRIRGAEDGNILSDVKCVLLMRCIVASLMNKSL